MVARDSGAGGAPCTNSTSARPLRVPTRAVELARLRSPSGVSHRYLGPTVPIGTSRLWIFNLVALSTPDTRPADRPLNYPSSARDGASMPWKSGPTGDWQLSENLDNRGMPTPVLLLNAAEQAGGNVSISISSLLRDPSQANEAVGFAGKSAGFDAANEMWFVRLTSGSNTASRGAEPLFKAPEPLFGQASVRDGDFFKLFACTGGGPSDAPYPCRVARVPVARVSERAAYQFYARDTLGTGEWTTDSLRAAPIVSASNSDISVSFNPYLQQFLMVYGMPEVSSVFLRTASAPEGPWSEPVQVEQPSSSVWYSYTTREHESLAQNCGKRIVISTWVALTTANGLPSSGDVVLSAIDLQ
jgi:hypothetical protein